MRIILRLRTWWYSRKLAKTYLVPAAKLIGKQVDEQVRLELFEPPKHIADMYRKGLQEQ